MNRLTRKEAAEHIGCGMTMLGHLERTGKLKGTFYQIGRRKLYIEHKLDEWALNGGTAYVKEKEREWDGK